MRVARVARGAGLARKSAVAAAARVAGRGGGRRVRGLATGPGQSIVDALTSNLRSMRDVEDLARVYGSSGAGTTGSEGAAAGGAGTDAAARPAAHMVVVKVGGEVIMKDLPNLVASVRFLRSFGLFPAVIHGGGPQLNDELAKAGVEPQYVGGHRVTDAATLAIAQRIFQSANAQLAAALEAGGVPAAAFPGEVFEAEQAEGGKLGFVGEITGVRDAAVRNAIRAGRVPVLSSLGLSPKNGQVYNINADVAARELTLALKPDKMVFISAGGGWKEDGQIVPELNIARDYHRLANRDYTGRQGTLLKLNEMKKIIDGLPASSSVVLCSASGLPAQLLPGRGPGTQIRRGLTTSFFSTAGSVDGHRLRTLLGKCGAPSLDAIVEAHGAELLGVLVTEDYSAVAIVTHTPPPDPVHGHGSGRGAADAKKSADKTAKKTSAGGSGGDSEADDDMDDWDLLSVQHPRLSALFVSPEAANAGAEDTLWADLHTRFPSLWWVSEPGAAAATGAVNGLAHNRAVLHADGAVKSSDVRAADASLASKTSSAASLAAKPSTSSGAGSGGLASGATVMWYGIDDLYEVEDMIAYAALSDEALRQEREASSASSPTSASASASKSAAPLFVTGAAKKKIALIGARGYVGRELVRLLNQHGTFEVVAAGSRALAGQSVLDALGLDASGPTPAVTPGLKFTSIEAEDVRAGRVQKMQDVDAWVLALPNGLCEDYASAIRAGVGVRPGREGVDGPVLLDLSADQRFDSSGVWIYGMPERPGMRERLRTAKCIANPGCYATGSQVGLMPLMTQFHEFALFKLAGAPTTGSAGTDAKALLADAAHVPHIFGVSGYSGAGTTPSDKNDPARLRDNLLAYSLVGHIHEREVGRHLGMRVAFSPHVAPFFQGIHLTLSCHLKDAPAGTPAEVVKALHDRYAAFYAGEKLIRVLPVGQMPDVASHGTLQHGVTVGGFTYDPKTKRVALVSVIDNLLKGAATQALQNLNLALGVEDEFRGILHDPHA